MNGMRYPGTVKLPHKKPKGKNMKEPKWAHHPPDGLEAFPRDHPMHPKNLHGGAHPPQHHAAHAAHHQAFLQQYWHK